MSLVQVFSDQDSVIGTPANTPLSDEALAAVAPGLAALGFEVETGKKASEKISVPVLYGENGKVAKTFQVDAWHPELKAVIEVEAGTAIEARKFYQDLYEAICLPEVDFLCIAVQKAYSPKRMKEKGKSANQFSKATDILDALFISDRIVMPLRNVLLIGY